MQDIYLRLDEVVRFVEARSKESVKATFKNGREVSDMLNILKGSALERSTDNVAGGVVVDAAVTGGGDMET